MNWKWCNRDIISFGTDKCWNGVWLETLQRNPINGKLTQQKLKIHEKAKKEPRQILWGMKSCKDWLRENIQFEVKRNPQEQQKHGEDSTSPTYPTAYPSPIVSYRGRKQFPFLWNSNNIRLIINLRSNKLREEKKQKKKYLAYKLGSTSAVSFQKGWCFPVGWQKNKNN